jgi:hypothetical protein
MLLLLLLLPLLLLLLLHPALQVCPDVLCQLALGLLPCVQHDQPGARSGLRCVPGGLDL